jgi:hypothetical protein
MSGCLAIEARNNEALAAQPGELQLAASAPGADANIKSPATAAGAPVVVVAPTVSRDVNPRARTWGYISEILHRAGLFFECIATDSLPSLLRRTDHPVVLLAGNLPLSSAQLQVLTAWVNQGGRLLGIGGASGLAEVFGVAGESPLAEGWMKVTARNHPVTNGLRSSLHVFGGCVVKPGGATSLAQVESGLRSAQGSAILENRFGKGGAVLLAPDLIFSIVHVQQGLPVLQDGKPAPDDSSPLDDGILKAEDGLVLEWRRDRRPMPPDNLPAFLEPISDELREIILRSIFHLAREQGTALAMLWYWPGRVKAVGHISHDTDGNDPQKAAALLDVMRRCDVRSTWCTLYPGGYPKDLYGRLQEQGYEIALHYDALTGGPETSWSKDNFFLQHRWLMKEAGLRHITSNKNHYTRWEGRLEFLRWCEEAGIESDQTRGPSKKGTVGFPLGGSQPYFPLDDEADSPRFLNVLEVSLLTQDLVIFCAREYGKPLLDSALRHHGVAHFLFHPAHILKPNVADTLSGLVDYGRQQGLPWWTSQQIVRWEKLRRSVRAVFGPAGAITLRAANPLQQATLLFLKTGARPRSFTVNGQAARSDAWDLHGFEFDAVTADIGNEVHVRMG